jgi:hypothetical protein
MKFDTRFALRPVAAALLLGCGLAHAQSASETALMKRLDQLAAELAAVKAELATMQQRAAAPAPTAQAMPAAAATPVAQAAPAAPAAAPALDAPGGARYGVEMGSSTVIGGYGEINYNRPRNSAKDTQADLRRAVIGIQHRFDEKTKVVTELEVEHAVSSASDAGEVALEQAYVEHQFTPTWAGRAGLFLVPMGLLNENHEPTAYYGVERNFVETAIIPSTWREGGVQAVGTFDNGLTVQGGVATGFNIKNWDSTKDSEGRQSPLGSIHQELSQANARDLSVFGAVNWRGVPGLLVGGGLFTGGASQGQVSKSRVTLWDVHARWTPGRWDLAAVYARGSITGTAALNAERTGDPNLIPRSFDGGYVQAAYKLWESGSYKLKPFVRWERFNTARSFADLGAGITPEALAAERVATAGANFDIGSGVVLKADYQKFKQNKDLDRFDLGLGWSF